jgi:hypothetical protein
MTLNLSAGFLAHLFGGKTNFDIVLREGNIPEGLT